MAEKAKAIIKAQIIAKDFVFFDETEEDKLLFRDCAKIWIEDVVPATCKHSTTVRYQSVLRKHLKQFNPRPIDEITRMDVKRVLLKKISTGLSKSSVNYMKNALSGIFYVAIDSEIIQYNPTSGLRLKLTSRNSKPPVVPLNKQELNLLLNTFRENRPEHYALTLLLARTGMRIGEALGLQWGDIDFNNRLITVQRGIVLNRI